MLDYKSQTNNKLSTTDINRKTLFLYSAEQGIIKCLYMTLFLILFFIPNLYGKESGVVGHYIEECSIDETISENVFVNIIKDVLGIKNIRSPKEAINMMRELFDTFKIIRGNDVSQQTQLGGKNLAFYKGKAFINGLIPTIDKYDNLYLKKDQGTYMYKVVQLYEVLGFNKEEAKKIETMARLNKCFKLLAQSIEYFPIQFWDDIKGKENSQIDAASDKYRQMYNNWNYKLQAGVDYIKSLQDLEIDTKNLKLSKNLALNLQMLHNAYSEASQKAQKILEKYLEKFGNYIAYFNIDDSVKFLSEIYQLSKTFSLLDRWIDVVKNPEYNRYTHTEYIIKYLHFNELTDLFIISFLDACENCEKMLAELTPQKSWKYNTIVISTKEYVNSRTRERLDNQTNFSLLLMQLSPQYFYSPLKSNTPSTYTNKRVSKSESSKVKSTTPFSFGKTAPMSTTKPTFELNSRSAAEPSSLIRTLPMSNKRRKIQ